MATPVDLAETRNKSLIAQRVPRAANENVVVFMLPYDLPVSLSPNDIEILRHAFEQQKSHGLWCGFTLLGEHRDAVTGEPLRASRVVLFTFGTNQPYFNLLRWLDGSYVLTDRNGYVLRQAHDLRLLLSVFELNLPTMH